MNCPQCNNEYQCPCPTCTKAQPNKKPWHFLECGELQMCPECGLTKNSNEWLDIEWQQMKEKQNG